MKTKKINKKLSLNKETVADLAINEMKEVYGKRGSNIPGISTCNQVHCICRTDEATICEWTCQYTCPY